jgi:hypothetical protein
MELYESILREDATKFEQFKRETGLLDLDENQFTSALERLESLLELFDISPDHVREIGVLLTKLRDETIEDNEEAYFYKLIGNYFQESYKLNLVRYKSKFKERASDPKEDNILLMPLISAFLKNGFLAKISVANQGDFERIKDSIRDQKGDILKLISDNPSEGISLVNSALVDGLEGSSYTNTPIATDLPKEGEEVLGLADSDWFKNYANKEIIGSLAHKVEDNKFDFELDLPAPEASEEGLAPEEEPEEGETGETGDEEISDDAFDDLFAEEPAGGGDVGGGSAPAPTEEEPEEEPVEEPTEEQPEEL